MIAVRANAATGSGFPLPVLYVRSVIEVSAMTGS